MVKPEIPLALDGGLNGVRGNYYNTNINRTVGTTELAR